MDGDGDVLPVGEIQGDLEGGGGSWVFFARASVGAKKPEKHWGWGSWTCVFFARVGWDRRIQGDVTWAEDRGDLGEWVLGLGVLRSGKSRSEEAREMWFRPKPGNICQSGDFREIRRRTTRNASE